MGGEVGNVIGDEADSILIFFLGPCKENTFVLKDREVFVLMVGLNQFYRESPGQQRVLFN